MIFYVGVFCFTFFFINVNVEIFASTKFYVFACRE